MEKELKSCTGVLLRADLTEHGHSSHSAKNPGMNCFYFLFLVKNKQKSDQYVEFLCGTVQWLILSVNVNVSPKAESLGHLFYYVKTSNDGMKVQLGVNRPKPKFFINRLRLRPPNLLANIFGLSLSFFWKKSVDFWHWKLTLKVQFWHFLMNHNSSTNFLKKISLEYVDSWPKILLFRTHHL